MSTTLKPWTKAAFELIVHAEIHLREGGDFDRRIAHIGFDNAIEVAISAYLGLNPMQRNGKHYERKDVEKWLTNYHTKLEFLEIEAAKRSRSLQVPNDELIYYHEIRNDQYHAAGPSIPAAEHLTCLRKASLDIFSMLFEIDDVEEVLDEWINDRSVSQDNARPRNATVDKLLDITGEPVNIFGSPYAVSEVLYATDPESYHAVAAAVSESRNLLNELTSLYPGDLKSELTHIGFVHYEDIVYLKTVIANGEITLNDTDFISGEYEGLFFSPHLLPDENGDRLVYQFDPYSIINCFEIFTKLATRRIARQYEKGRAKQHRSPDDGESVMV